MNILKWLGTALIVVATLCRAFDFHMADMACTLVGSGIWAYAAWRTNDKALLVVNVFSALIMMAGIYHAKGE